MINHKTSILLLFFTALLSCGKESGNGNAGAGATPAATYFTNPLLSTGPDPWVAQDANSYYFTATTGEGLTVYQTSKMSQLGHAASKNAWTPPASGAYSHDIWAPELHFIQNKWYAYFAADNGNDTTHRIYVLQSNDASPYTNSWTFKGQLTPTTDRWAIDPTVFEYNGALYAVWSGWAGYNQPGYQQLYVAKMKDPFTISGDRLLISQPDYGWEKNGSPVNEGPEILTNSAGKVFLVYSASSCFTDDYCLGMLTLTDGSDPMVAANWTKARNPVFTKNTSGNTFGPGHCGFFISKDATQNWIVYHANSSSGEGCGNQRNPRMQKFTWNADGTPNFGTPLPAGMNIPAPSGE
jgi:GH43 family beta-xylosidase